LFDESADGFPAKITVTTEQGQLAATIQFGLDAEVLWSPDSNSFAVTGSLQSANGPFQTDVFAIHGDQLERVSISRLITLTFGHPVKCGWPESPNVGAIRWVVPSQQILVAAEIVHHSNCDSFGTFKAYTVELAGPRILKTYNQLQTKRLFASDLGEELIQANDKCIRDPRSCYVPANHEEPAPDLH
jgi:hypothetical protein